MHRPVTLLRSLVLLAPLAGPAAAAPAPPAAEPPAAGLPAVLFDRLTWRFIGPAGNRVSAVAGVPGDPNVYFVGAASGGIFKSEDGGGSWRPVFDDQPVASIGALAVAPSDPNVVWAGTGEAFIRSNISHGNGIYRSTDGGESWQAMGLEGTGRIARIAVHPADPDVAFVAALGHGYGSQQERGVYRTTDAGITWERVLFVDAETGACDVVMDPRNPRVLFAGMWQLLIRPWGRTSGGPGSGIWVSRDGGDTWSRLSGDGLPEPPLGRIGLAVSPVDSDRVWALIETNSNRDFAPLDQHAGVLWRSDDGGRRWRMVNGSHELAQRPLYYSRLVPAPDDRDEVYFLSTRMLRSLDGGLTTSAVEAGGDHHDLWIDPRQPDRMIVGHDLGVSLSTNRGRSWRRPQLPIAQIYHAATDDRIPYRVYGNRQDGPSLRGPSNSLHAGGIPLGAWQTVGGCESGFAVPVPPDGRWVWSGCYDGALDLYDAQSGHARDVSVWPLHIESWAARDLRYRFQWTFPVALSPHDPRRVYVGSQYVHQSTDYGQSWTAISPDLTGDDPALQVGSGGLTPDDAGPTVAPVVFALAESPLERGLLWAGTNDGKLQATRDGGASWTDLTTRLPDLPMWGTVSNIEPSRHRPGTAYLTVDAHQTGDFDPYVYQTTDYGRTWERLDFDLPRGPLAFAHCVREDPARPGLLYLGTESGVFTSLDDGASWMPLRGALPPAPVHWLEVQARFGDLVAATYGRGFWILDDLSPLRQLAEKGLAAATGAGRDVPPLPLLFGPRPAWRYRLQEPPMMPPADPAAGANPPYGAALHYWLPGPVGAGERLEIAILDARGEAVRVLGDLAREAGLHRVIWDLRGEATPEPRLRTPPAEHAHGPLPERGTRSLIEAGRLSLLAPPGDYTVRLSVGASEQSRPLAVLADPRSQASAADLAAQTEALQTLRRLADRTARMIDELEWARRQLADLTERLDGSPLAARVGPEGRELAAGLASLEDRLFDRRLTEAGQDTLRWPRHHYAQVLYLAAKIGATDDRPTDAQRAVLAELEADHNRLEGDLEGLRKGSVPAFNRRLRDLGVEPVSLRAIE